MARKKKPTVEPVRHFRLRGPDLLTAFHDAITLSNLFPNGKLTCERLSEKTLLLRVEITNEGEQPFTVDDGNGLVTVRPLDSINARLELHNP